MQNSDPGKENGLLNILINVVAPVVILNHGSKQLGPLPALLLALSLPLGYGVWDALKRKKINAFSALGFLNVLVTGGLALAGLGGSWFSLKEAAFPFLIGCFVLGSAYTKKPFIESLLLNPAVMNLDLVEEKLLEKKAHSEFHQHLRVSTIFLAASFFLSAVLNFVLAQKIFLPLDPAMEATARSVALNEQIAQMTARSFLVIMVPSMVMLMGILWYLLAGIKRHTGLQLEQILKG